MSLSLQLVDKATNKKEYFTNYTICMKMKHEYSFKNHL